MLKDNKQALKAMWQQIAHTKTRNHQTVEGVTLYPIDFAMIMRTVLPALQPAQVDALALLVSAGQAGHIGDNNKNDKVTHAIAHELHLPGWKELMTAVKQLKKLYIKVCIKSSAIAYIA